MRYAIVSDLHANRRAWDAVLADLCDLGADLVVCLGDIVGYGPSPSEVLAAVRSVTENCVMGNHDAATAGLMDYSIFNDHARQAIEWTMQELDPEARRHLASLPLAIDTGEILFVHAEVPHPGRFDYITTPAVARENFAASSHFVTFYGHTHQPTVFEQGRKGKVSELPDHDLILDPSKRYLVNVGSVGEPRDPRDLRARYVIYDDETRRVTFRRVEFDIAAYRQDLEATTLALRPFFLRVYEHLTEGQEQAVSPDGEAEDMQVPHDSETLVDLGQVSGVAQLHEGGGRLKHALASRAPSLILAVAVVMALVFAGFGIFDKPSSSPSRPPVPKSDETERLPAKPVDGPSKTSQNQPATS